MSGSIYPRLFEPIQIGPLTVKNRIEAAPAAPMLASSDSLVSPQLIEYTRRLAEGGAGIVTVGISLVNPEAKVPCILNLSEDKVVYQLSVLAETIQRYGAKASIELTPLAFGPGGLNTPDNIVSPADAFSQREIQNTITHFVKAVERCILAGMDMVLVHGGHGLFVSNFFSPLFNHRSDKYGGSLENRARFAIELLDAIRAAVGRKIAIEYRISADELLEGGAGLDETIAFSRLIQDKIDLLHVSAGMLTHDEVLQHTIQPTYFKRGYNVHFAEFFKKALTIPVATVGSIDLPLAEAIVQQGRADMVAMIRSLIADPDGVNKARRGWQDTICPCIRCNLCINRTHYFPLPLRCAVNPLAGREFEFRNSPPPKQLKKVAVIGGGPAGMQAARTLADRGHQIVLFEKESTLGGMLTVAQNASFKGDVKAYLEWAVRMTLRSKRIDLHLATLATPEKVLAQNPDAIIIATGAKPWRPPIPGIDLDLVVWAKDVETNSVSIGHSVVVAGGGQTGCEIALSLAQQGKEVTIVEMVSLGDIIRSAPIITMNTLVGLLRQHQVDIRTSTRLKQITADSVMVEAGREDKRIACDTVVIALGVRPDQEMVDRFIGLAPEVVVVGDSSTSKGNIWTATTTAFNAAMAL